MSEHIQHIKRYHNNGVTDETAHSVDTEDYPARAAYSSESTAARIVWFIAGVIIAFLALRFVFILFGANQGNGFVNFIYSVSHPFAAPFFGIFSYRLHYGVSRFEIASLVGIAVYALIAWGIARLLTIRQP